MQNKKIPSALRGATATLRKSTRTTAKLTPNRIRFKVAVALAHTTPTVIDHTPLAGLMGKQEIDTRS